MDSINEAVRNLRHTEYICVTICSNYVNIEQFDVLRRIGPTPIVVLSPDCSIDKRAEYFQRGASDFIIQEYHLKKKSVITQDAVQYYLNHTNKATKPLTIGLKFSNVSTLVSSARAIGASKAMSG